MKHEIIKVPEVLFPVSHAPHARAFSRAMDKLVKPRKAGAIVEETAQSTGCTWH